MVQTLMFKVGLYSERKNVTTEGGVGGDYGTALCAATANGRLEVMNLLLENDAKVDIQGEMFGAPLHVVGLIHSTDNIKYSEVIRQLLDKQGPILEPMD
ncbi:hypothetical protein GYMLUDRAFT_836381 [Collybiopsis luxurians FD-317 M1]|uniref:Uncharacterized protein n=1 Tax=Collybiopsis luxurians FD-317 M1 TaxID=944289 RepID=A0A0D0BZX2_9AGAR|nr:hypothetical protein GYMLUDRAFT_836381 [Collybiopsis luxurians FD-317 M1]